MMSRPQGVRPSRPQHLFIALSLFATSLLHAEPPKLEAFFPSGGQIGSTFPLTGIGKLDDTVRLWTDAPGVHFVPTGKKREWQTTITAQAQPGLYLVYALNDEGVSEPHRFSIGRYAELTEAEPNDELGKGQPVAKLPLCLNARLDKGDDVDGYSLDLKAGQTLVALIEAYALGSPVDVMAHVVDPQGIRVLTVSDGRNLDPFITYKAEKAGRYTLQIAGFAHPPTADVRFTGGATVIYRLHLSTGPVVTQIHPAAIAATGKTEVELIGHNLDPKKTRFTIDAAQAHFADSLASITPPDAIQPIQAVAVSKPAALEKEPNNEIAQATPVQTGAIAGIISDKGDIDRFALPMKKGDKMQARLYSKQLGLPLDATLRIEGPDGKPVTGSIDQGPQPDPTVNWNAAVDGTYQIIVEDQFHRGGADHRYVLDLSPAVPAYAVTLPERKPVTLAPGKTLSAKLTVKPLNGFKAPLIARVSGLPIGVQAADVPVPEKGGDIDIKLQAASNAPRSTQPITFQVWTTQEPLIQVTAGYPLRITDEIRGTSLLDRASWLWLEVR